MRFICSGWGRARSATGWFSSASLGHRIHRTAFAKGIDDGYGNEPNATVAYLSSLEGSREERAFELAKNEYLAWLEHKADRYTTVYGYMD